MLRLREVAEAAAEDARFSAARPVAPVAEVATAVVEVATEEREAVLAQDARPLLAGRSSILEEGLGSCVAGGGTAATAVRAAIEEVEEDAAAV